MNKENMIKKIFYYLLPTIHWLLSAIMAGWLFCHVEYNEAYSSARRFPDSMSVWAKACVVLFMFICAGIIFFAGYRAVYKILFQKNSKEKKILMYSIPYMVIMAGYLLASIYEISKTGYTGDEGFTWNMAVSFFPFTFVYLSGLYLLCFFLLPVSVAPSVIKIIFIALVVGYIVYRTEKYYHTKWAYLLYAVFMLQPVQSYGIRVHRMHWYAFLYLFAAVKLFFDEKEKAGIEINEKRVNGMIVCMSFVLALLSIWRREGIYFLVFGTYFLTAAYQRKRDWRKAAFVFFSISIIVWLPRLIYEKDHTLEDAGIVWQSYAVHMLADPSLNRADYQEEIDLINEVLDVEKIDLYNAEKGDSGYAEAYWASANYENNRYYAVRKGLSEEQWRLFRKAVFHLALKEPVIFLKSRLRGFCFVAAKYDQYNLFIPFLMCFLILGYSLKKKEKLLGLLFCCLIFHTLLTMIFMPASYFKYFFQMYLCAYTFFFIICLAENKISPKKVQIPGAAEELEVINNFNEC